VASLSAAAAWLTSECTFGSNSQYPNFFACPSLTSVDTATIGGKLDTLSYNNFAIMYELFDSTGTPQSMYDSVSTDSALFNVGDTARSAFTFNGDTVADTITHQHQVTASNLKGDPDTLRIWNSTGSGLIHLVVIGQTTKSYQLSSTDSTTGLYIQQPFSSNPYPLQGTIVRNYMATLPPQGSDTTTQTATLRVAVTFNGTANVPLTVQTASGPTSYTLNLDTFQVTKNP
jgi:hypothetical protein